MHIVIHWHLYFHVQGNTAFKAAQYVEAIGHYTDAILASPSEPTYFLNRAAAYLKLVKYVFILLP
jgi:hypothetical protein